MRCLFLLDLTVSAGQGVCDGKYAGDDSHSNAADVGVLRLLVYHIADEYREGKNYRNREEPNANFFLKKGFLICVYYQFLYLICTKVAKGARY